MAKKGKSRDEGPSGGAGSDTKASASERRERRKRDQAPTSGGALEWAKSVAIAVVLFLVLRTFLVQTFVITSGSMEDTLLVGDMLLVNRAAIGSRIPATNLRVPGYSEPEVGDVLVFDPPHEPDLKLIKRLVGMPGDTLEMRNRVLYKNGQVVDEPYVVHADKADEAHPWMSWQREYLLDGMDPTAYAPTRDNWGPLVVPEAHYFMLGDNRENSFDSRYWGPLEAWRLEGRAVFTYYSYNKDSYRPFPAIREVRWDRIGRGIS
ncbi:MAG: signal peptidase I [Longimicrobiales bacterium]|nr:signal peptidase I [Longimicrobiales bacterium]